MADQDRAHRARRDRNSQGRAAHRRSACSPSSGSPARTGRRAPRLRSPPADVRSEPRGYVQRRATSRWCQRSSVRGLTKNTDQDRRGSARLNAASSIRSACRSCGGLACRRRIESSCLNTKISSSFELDDRQHSTSNANSRHATRYTNDDNTHDLQQTGHRRYSEASAIRPHRLTEFSNPTRIVPWNSARPTPTNHKTDHMRAKSTAATASAASSTSTTEPPPETRHE